MTTKSQNQEPQNSAPSQPEAGPSAEDLNQAKAEAIKAERNRQAKIRKACAAASLPSDFADDLAGQDITAAEAHERIFAKLAEQGPKPTVNANPSVTVGTDAREKFVDGATKALLARTGLEKHEANNPFNSFSLKEMARRAAVEAGADANLFITPMDVAGAGFNPMAYGGQTSSDFSKVLENVINKQMLVGWEEAAETFMQWTRSGQLSDFKVAQRVGLNLFDDLDEVVDGAEYKHGTVGDRGESIQLATYGKLFAITRHAIVNDDMQAFSAIPRKMGRAAARTIGNLVYAILTSNPNMDDGSALFSVSTHKNAATGAALGVDTLDAARVAMATQKDPESKADGGLNIRPSYLVVPAALEGQARVLMQSQFVPGSQNNDINKVSGMAEIVSDARLDAASATTWFLAADPNAYDTIEVAYLNGVQTPTLEQKEGWSIDGTHFKVRHDAGVKALDYRGLYRGQA